MLAEYTFRQTYEGNAKLIIENRDAFRYIREKGEPADVAILLLPPPSTLSLNRFYTTEFFNDLKERLVTGGVFMCSPGRQTVISIRNQ